MGPNITTKKTGNSQQLFARLAELIKKDVLVGIPAENASRKGGGINNAELLFIQTHGSPLHNIPPRPVIEPAIMADGNREQIQDELKGAMSSFLHQDPHESLRHLRMAGMRGMAAAKDWFTDPRNGWPPNAASTVRAKLRKLEGARKEEALAAIESGASMDGVNTPLIDHGDLRRAITYVVRDK